MRVFLPVIIWAANSKAACDNEAHAAVSACSKHARQPQRTRRSSALCWKCTFAPFTALTLPNPLRQRGAGVWTTAITHVATHGARGPPANTFASNTRRVACTSLAFARASPTAAAPRAHPPLIGRGRAPERQERALSGRRAADGRSRRHPRPLPRDGGARGDWQGDEARFARDEVHHAVWRPSAVRRARKTREIARGRTPWCLTTGHGVPGWTARPSMAPTGNR